MKVTIIFGFYNSVYNLAFVWALFNTGSSFVALDTSPFTFSFPDMNSRCAFTFPLTSFAKSSSVNERVTGAPGSVFFRLCETANPSRHDL